MLSTFELEWEMLGIERKKVRKKERKKEEAKIRK
jgi:hypothetical protein